MKSLTTFAVFLAFGLFGIVSLQAHHSMSTYNMDEEVTIEGAVTRIQWVNPHVFIYLDQETGPQQLVSWAVEGVNPSGMRRRGWNRNTLSLGDIITVTGNTSKNMATPGMYPQTIFRNGEKLYDERVAAAEMFTPVELPGTSASSIAGVWKGPLTPAVIIPPQLDTPYQPGIGLHNPTEKGLEALAQFDELSMNPGADCTQIPAPLIMHFGDFKQITIANDVVKIAGDYDGGERTVYMDIDSHQGAQFSNQGHSIGRWEGTTLVIDTTHFADSAFGSGFGLPSGSQKHLSERISLGADGRTIAYQFELTDSEFLATPMTLETEWVYQPDYEFLNDECSLESARRFLEN